MIWGIAIKHGYGWFDFRTIRFLFIYLFSQFCYWPADGSHLIWDIFFIFNTLSECLQTVQKDFIWYSYPDQLYFNNFCSPHCKELICFKCFSALHIAPYGRLRNPHEEHDILICFSCWKNRSLLALDHLDLFFFRTFTNRQLNAFFKKSYVKQWPFLPPISSV